MKHLKAERAGRTACGLPVVRTGNVPICPGFKISRWPARSKLAASEQGGGHAWNFKCRQVWENLLRAPDLPMAMSNSNHLT
jgi:hypothetical protein